jgi:DNA-binding transcriptional LysR family regulator
MKTKSPSWDDLRVLLAVYREKSFLAAGTVLGIAASTVARRIDALEQDLGHPVVQRASDGVRIASDGLRLVALAEEMELGLSLVVRAGRVPDVSGTVRLSLSEGFVRPLVPVLARLHARHPGLNIELIAESRLVDIARGEADIGVRIARSRSPALISKFLGKAPTGLFASSEYLERKLSPAKLSRAAAATQSWVGFDASLSRLPHHVWMCEYGAARFVFRSNSALAIEQAILSGMGIGLLSEFQGRALTSLIQLELEAPPPPVELYLAYHRDGKKVPRIQAVVKEIEGEIRRMIA